LFRPQLIELMGGRIQLESEYGVGTTMTVEVRLDKVSNQALAASTSSSPASADMLKKEDVQILVVDDNELNRSICTRLLSKAGFSVESVGNGYEALEALERKRFDLVLMDNQMEGLDGLQTTIRIRQSNNPQVAHVKIIALTASALKGDRDAFLASGADGYLSKVSDRHSHAPPWLAQSPRVTLG
jgi:CheY-like chemotaxis protein